MFIRIVWYNIIVLMTIYGFILNCIFKQIQKIFSFHIFFLHLICLFLWDGGLMDTFLTLVRIYALNIFKVHWSFRFVCFSFYIETVTVSHPNYLEPEIHIILEDRSKSHQKRSRKCSKIHKKKNIEKFAKYSKLEENHKRKK